MDAARTRKSDVTETQSLADWKMAVLPLFDKLTQRSTYVGAAVRLKSVAAHLSPETLGPFVVCVPAPSHPSVPIVLPAFS